LTKQIDPTRLVEDNSPCHFDHVETDINSWHAYAPGFEWEDTLNYICKHTFPGSKWNYIGGNVQNNAPMLNSECGNVWGYKGSTGDVDITWDYHKMINAFRAHPQCAGWLYTEHHDVVNEWNGYVRYDRSPKIFGLDAFVPNMTMADFHSPYYVSTRCELMQEVQAGSRVEIPLFLSIMTDKNPGTMQLETSIAGWNELGQEIKESPIQQDRIEFVPYMNKLLQPIQMKLPELNGLYTVRFVLRGEAGNILGRNFILFRVKGGEAIANNRSTRLVSFAPNSYSNQVWSIKQWNVMNNQKVNGSGFGFFEYQVQLPSDLDLEKVKNVVLVFEASAKTLFGKDKEGVNKTFEDLDFMIGKGNYDPGKNKNAYPQTDEKRFPSQVHVSINGKPCGSATLPDDPADHRGALSWFTQGKKNTLEEAGSYGYLIEINVPKEILKADKTTTIRLEVPKNTKGGLAIYGKETGRYPVEPTLVFNMKE
ncbi:MAG: glycoside hydrolase family 2, partial [Parabacteroides sp.]|nr:glycoside hydrolase family 2 [Parabacteroides sp.]